MCNKHTNQSLGKVNWQSSIPWPRDGCAASQTNNTTHAHTHSYLQSDTRHGRSRSCSFIGRRNSSSCAPRLRGNGYFLPIIFSADCIHSGRVSLRVASWCSALDRSFAPRFSSIFNYSPIVYRLFIVEWDLCLIASRQKCRITFAIILLSFYTAGDGSFCDRLFFCFALLSDNVRVW